MLIKVFNEKIGLEEYKVHLANHCIDTNQAFTHYQHPTFRKLIDVCSNLSEEAKKHKPTAKTIKATILVEGEKHISKMKNMFEEFDGRVNLTTDGWTSTNGKSFISVTVHYIDSSFKQWNIQCEIVEITVSHTGLNLAITLYEACCRLGINDKVNRRNIFD